MKGRFLIFGRSLCITEKVESTGGEQEETRIFQDYIQFIDLKRATSFIH